MESGHDINSMSILAATPTYFLLLLLLNVGTESGLLLMMPAAESRE